MEVVKLERSNLLQGRWEARALNDNLGKVNNQSDSEAQVVVVNWIIQYFYCYIALENPHQSQIVRDLSPPQKKPPLLESTLGNQFLRTMVEFARSCRRTEVCSDFPPPLSRF